MNWLFTTWLYHVLRTALAALFVLAGAVKLLDLDAFARVIYDFGLVPDPTVFTLAVTLSVAELVAGLGLLIDLRGTLAAITAMLIGFLGVLTYGLWLGLDIECGCFGPGDPIGISDGLRATAARDTILLAVCCYLYASRLRRAERPATLSVFHELILKTFRGTDECEKPTDGA